MGIDQYRIFSHKLDSNEAQSKKADVGYQWQHLQYADVMQRKIVIT